MTMHSMPTFAGISLRDDAKVYDLTHNLKLFNMRQGIHKSDSKVFFSVHTMRRKQPSLNILLGSM